MSCSPFESSHEPEESERWTHTSWVIDRDQMKVMKGGKRFLQDTWTFSTAETSDRVTGGDFNIFAFAVGRLEPAAEIKILFSSQGGVANGWTRKISNRERYCRRPGHFFPVKLVYCKVISGFQAVRQAGASVAGLEPSTEGSQQISGQANHSLCHQGRPAKTSNLRSSTEVSRRWVG
ncbi:hypothetical protein PoB_006906000 [Plakobranchus ocellatus]|uniref:MAM domain-containing protein n=1 Tax=Plakobranchus ocellatus TaxID=259542 RepID=A0AAV4DEY5_9GAST|nr:hypothetical protein PoB_006906000 [Plakobranchus ocellatus]